MDTSSRLTLSPTFGRRLAHAILAVAQENEDVAGLKKAALQQMALD